MANVSGRKHDGLYPKERKFLKEIANGKSPTQAVLASYNTTNPVNAASIANRIMKRNRFIAIMEREGLTAHAIVEQIKQGIKADKLLFYDHQTYNPPDWFARLAFIRLILKSQGILDEVNPAETEEHDPLIIKSVQIDNRSITINDGKPAEVSAIDK